MIRTTPHTGNPIYRCHVQGCTAPAVYGYGVSVTTRGTWACRKHQLEDKR